jgi:group II intron reverse transcriptase/maturase
LRLIPLPTVRKLQETLHAKAKSAPTYRFYALYDKMYRLDVIRFAYGCCFDNGGAAGVDGETFDAIEEYGWERWVDELAEELRKGTYRPQAVRRVYIPKPDGKQRPLGIPTIRDRVVQMAALVVLEPIFEADLQPEQHAYRPGQSALDAVRKVQELLDAGHREVIDADLSGYFDSIPHAELVTSVARRVSDGRLLRLIKSWLEAPVEEQDDRGRKRRTTRAKDEGRGTLQGAPLSPLLSNLYMRRFILGWKSLGHQRRLDAFIVNYADDFVICCRGTAEEAMTCHAVDDVEAAFDGERDENAAVPPAWRYVQLSGIYLRSSVLAEDGRRLPRRSPVGQEDPSDLRGHQRANRTPLDIPGPRRFGWPPEPHVGGLGQLFQSGRWARPIASWTPTHAFGSVSGWDDGSACRVSDDHDIRNHTCVAPTGSSSSQAVLAASRERPRDSLSESRMRQIRKSGLTSGRWKRNTACGAEPRRGNPDTRKCRRLNNRATSRLYYPLSNSRPAVRTATKPPSRVRGCTCPSRCSHPHAAA